MRSQWFVKNHSFGIIHYKKSIIFDRKEDHGIHVVLEKPMLTQPVKAELLKLLNTLASLQEGVFLQAFKISEDGERVIVRLSEQDGRRGKQKLSLHVTPINMLKEDEGIETRVIEYKPFEIVMFAVKL